ncbi:uncharacterized protein LOC122665626 [Telopea speciosissima]|uniref:uncharacterized protein LOC122665626 n=1 Tax=Telopea speciosissima TaxID=54955 RepID=UPI001CC33A57|nr:uncharacterized protein LOC122665626 [Telopea speciosissima]
MEFIRQCWTTPVFGPPLYILSLKLKLLRSDLRSWNKSVFGNIHQNARNAEDGVSSEETEFDQNPNEVTREVLAEARNALKDILLQEEIFWKQKSRIRWLKERERNTKFFHAMVNVRRTKKKGVEKIKDGKGSWISGEVGVSTEAIRYFSEIFSLQSIQTDEDLLHMIPRLVTDVENSFPMISPSLEDVKKAVFELSRDSAPSSEGFSGYSPPIVGKLLAMMCGKQSRIILLVVSCLGVTRLFTWCSFLKKKP